MNLKDLIRAPLIALAALLLFTCGRPVIFGADSAKGTTADLKFEAPTTLTATIGAKGSGEKSPLFLFKRQATRSGSTLTVSREYTYPDGRPGARERMVYDGDNPRSLELEDLQTGARGSAKIRPDPGNPARRVIHFEYAKDAAAGGKPKTNEETLRPDTVTDDMLGPFLAAHWEALAKGETVKCRYLYVPRRETIGFTFVKDSDSTWHGREVAVIKMAPTSLIISALVDPSFFALEKTGQHRVLQYVGRTVPKTRAGAKWNDLDAEVVFNWQ